MSMTLLDVRKVNFRRDVLGCEIKSLQTSKGSKSSTLSMVAILLQV